MRVAIVRGGTGMLGRQVAQELRARPRGAHPQPPKLAAQDRPDHG